jgi:hypothetical protein
VLVSGESGWRLRICLDLDGRGHTLQEVGVVMRSVRVIRRLGVLGQVPCGMC